MNGATCSDAGMVFDGSNDYLNVDPWEFGGSLSFETYVSRTMQNGWDRIFHFSNHENDDVVALAMVSGTSNSLYLLSPTSVQDTSNSFYVNQWVHAVVTIDVIGSTVTAKIYVDGDLKNTATGSSAPATMTRSYHHIGARNDFLSNHMFGGTVAHLRF